MRREVQFVLYYILFDRTKETETWERELEKGLHVTCKILWFSVSLKTGSPWTGHESSQENEQESKSFIGDTSMEVEKRRVAWMKLKRMKTKKKKTHRGTLRLFTWCSLSMQNHVYYIQEATEEDYDFMEEFPWLINYACLSVTTAKRQFPESKSLI